MKLPKFRSFIYPREYDINEDLFELRRELLAIGKLESLKDHAGWSAIEEVLLAHIKSMEERICELAFRPEENKVELQGLSALRISASFFLSLPELKSGDKKKLIEDIETRLRIVKETTERATAQATTA